MAKKQIELPTLEVSEVDVTELMKDPVIHAKTVQLGLGVDLLGSRMSLNASRGNTLKLHEFGVIATSGKNGRRVLVPWSNIKGVELFSDETPAN